MDRDESETEPTYKQSEKITIDQKHANENSQNCAEVIEDKTINKQTDEHFRQKKTMLPKIEFS